MKRKIILLTIAFSCIFAANGQNVNAPVVQQPSTQQQTTTTNRSSSIPTVASLQKEIAELKTQLAAEQGKVSLLQEMLKEQPATAQQLQNQLSSLQLQKAALEKTISEKTAEITKKDADIKTLQSSNESYYKELNQWYNIFPILVSDIELASWDNNNSKYNIDFGGTLYANSIYYLSGRIRCSVYKEVPSMSINVRIINKDRETISTGDTSPAGFTLSRTINVKYGSDIYYISSWGNASGSSYSAGNWRIEIWYGNKCIGAKDFVIY